MNKFDLMTESRPVYAGMVQVMPYPVKGDWKYMRVSFLTRYAAFNHRPIVPTSVGLSASCFSPA